MADRLDRAGTTGPARWWIAVPDRPDADRAAATLVAGCPSAGVLARHASGRVWILGRYPSVLVDAVGDGSTRVAVLAVRGRDPGELRDAERVARCGGRGVVEAVVRRPGVATVAVSGPDRLEVYADPVGTHPVCWTVRGGVTMLSSHARLLRFGAAVDDGWLAARLLLPAVPRALAYPGTAFAGVSAVRPGSVATVGAAGVSVRPWWQPPDPPGLGASDGAARLGEALSSAVRAVAGPARGAGSVSVSIAGPPSLALAAICGRVLPDVALLYLTVPSAPVVDVGLYARIAAGWQPYAEQQRIMPADQPVYGSGLDQLPALDEPPPFALGIARLTDVARRARQWGAGVHLSGRGGLEALVAPCSYLRHWQREPARRDTHLRGWSLAHGLSPTALRGLLAAEPGSYPDWLARLAGALREPHPPLATGWEPESRLPDWATPAAVEAVRDRLGRAAADAEPLARCAGQHHAVAQLQVAARTGSLVNDVTAALGVPVEAPYLDLRVVEACLATVPEQRTDPFRPLSLLARALPHLPGAELHRPRRGPTTDTLTGLRDSRATLAALVDDSELRARGLIDVDPLRPVLAEPWCHESQVGTLINTLAVEAWLRTV